MTNGWLRINLRPIDIANLALLAACWHYVLTIMPFSCMLCRREKTEKITITAQLRRAVAIVTEQYR